MNAFLGELAKKLAERWLTLLVLPGLLYISVITVASVLGQRHAIDAGMFFTWIDTISATPASHTPAGVLAGAVGVLIGAAGAGLAAAALGQLAQQVWITPGRRAPARWLTNWLTSRRRLRWVHAYEAVSTARQQLFNAPATASPATVEDLRLKVVDAESVCRRICPVPADRPTWIADRLHALDERIHHTYRLDLSAAWPRLWLLIPDTARTELTTAHDTYAAAARLAGWALLYLAVGIWWWPALIIAAITGISAKNRTRAATEVLADLVEATVDLYGLELARQLGITCTDRLTQDIGRKITIAVRKDDTLHLSDTPMNTSTTSPGQTRG